MFYICLLCFFYFPLGRDAQHRFREVYVKIIAATYYLIYFLL